MKLESSHCVWGRMIDLKYAGYFSSIQLSYIKTSGICDLFTALGMKLYLVVLHSPNDMKTDHVHPLENMFLFR